MRETPHKHPGAARGESGFTLVELLVVMLILALLAAIAIPSFFNQRDKAKDADAKEYAAVAQRAIETFATDQAGSYFGATPAELVALEGTLVDAPLAIDSATTDSYSLTTTSDTGTTFTIRRFNTGAVEHDCAPRGSGGCPPGSGW